MLSNTRFSTIGQRDRDAEIPLCSNGNNVTRPGKTGGRFNAWPILMRGNFGGNAAVMEISAE